MQNRKRFKTKAFISFTITWTFLISSIAGIILYIAPQGRIANWTLWTVIGLEKEQWGAIHTLMSFLFLTIGIIHLFIFNWPVFVAYLKDKKKKSLKLKAEFFSSIALVTIFLLGTYLQVPPFQTVVDISTKIDEYWANNSGEPPVSHAEDLTIEDLAANQLNTSTKNVISILQKNDIVANSNDILSDIADESGYTPSDIYEIISSQLNQQVNTVATKGYGQKPLNYVCADMKISVIDAFNYLQEEGIDISSDLEGLSEVAYKNNLKATDIVKNLISHFDVELL